LLVAFAAYVRLIGTEWDGTAGLHPDERHMLFVSLRLMRALQALTGEESLSELWFSEATSPLNPRGGGESYVYGEAPVLITTLIGWLFGKVGWDDVMILGRQLSAAIDSLTVLAVFMISQPLLGWRPALFAAVLYAAAPTALQLSNFYTVDIWLTAGVTWALFALMALDRSDKPSKVKWRAVTAGMAGGAALACKITALALAFPAIIVVWRIWQRFGPRNAFLAAALALVGAFITFRLLNPFAFAGPGFIGVMPAESYLKDLRSVMELADLPDFPPAWQWMAGYGPLRFLRDAALFGFGPVITLLALLFVYRQTTVKGRTTPAAILIPASLAAAYILYGALSQVAVLRYVAPAIPSMAVVAAGTLFNWHIGFAVLAAAISLWWGSAVVKLHDGRHPRLLATAWLWSLPKGTTLLNETSWDEGLPALLRFPGQTDKRYPEYGGHFKLLTLDIVAPDSQEKAVLMADRIATSDYVIVSSGRQSEVMPRLPKRFPLTKEYYKMLESGEACLDLVWTLDRGYPLPGYRLNDQWAQEPWRVYDHPIVKIYERSDCFDQLAFRQKLLDALKTQ
jgi:hypothetical protein